MTPVALILWGIVTLMAAMVGARKGTAGLRGAGVFAWGQASSLAIRLPMALLAASFLTQILPTDMVADVLGPETGLWGIVLASVVGGLLPGGPMLSFPLALVIWQSGAGEAQTVALLAGWSVFAMHRMLAFEAPMMGWRFVALRLLSSCALPVLAGLLAASVLGLFEILFL
ncbi:MAG: hypothetical protein JJU21_13940 [Salinarimonas sp.]|nr:hypothetical protein [Salinarimonas sp.]